MIDLGSSCYTSDVLSSYVQSRAYRAPEVVLGLPYGQVRRRSGFALSRLSAAAEKMHFRETSTLLDSQVLVRSLSYEWCPLSI